MKIENEIVGEVAVLRLNGKLEPVGASDMSKLLGELMEKGNTKILVDMKNLSFVSSAGLGVFIRSNIKLREKGGSLKLVFMGQNVRVSFEVTGSLPKFEIFDDFEKAMNSF